MKIVIAGAHGFIGTAVSAHLEKSGHNVVRLSRKEGEPNFWDPQNGQLDPALLEGADVVINLAGESIMGRWTEAKLEKIRSSRILTSQLLVETLLKMETKPALYIGASAIGYYGNRGDEKLTEQSPAGSGELADIVRVWEEIPQALEGSMRVVRMRFGVVLDKSGGALAKMLPAFKMGCGGILGSGKQMISWIAMEDLVRAVVFVMDNPIQGAVNCVAPNPVTNLEFTKTLGHQLHRPTILPMPETFIKLIFGSGAEIFLDSKNVMPQKLLSNNFVFSFPHLREALPVLC